MTRKSDRAGRPAGKTPLPELYIEFDGRQLTVRTDVGEVRNFFRNTYEHMLVPAVAVGVGSLDVVKTKSGYRVRGVGNPHFKCEGVEPMLQYIKEEVRSMFVRSRPDLLWLHAGAVERDDKALLLSGPSGQGKSTLTTLLCERGWRMVSDDLAPVQMTADVVVPFSQSPSRRIYPGRELPPDEMHSLDLEAVPIASDLIRRDPAQIAAIVFIAFCNNGETVLDRLPPGTAAWEILRNSSNFDDDKSGAADRAARLARTVPVFTLSYGDARDAAARLGTLE